MSVPLNSSTIWEIWFEISDSLLNELGLELLFNYTALTRLSIYYSLSLLLAS